MVLITFLSVLDKEKRVIYFCQNYFSISNPCFLFPTDLETNINFMNKVNIYYIL